ncbi:hormogonium polysaccharide biosynthesis protein HpsA [Tolypothrix sp. NIES-4075]|uniref:hormogonium polysaccharide biosynthesis protein HpsA n=1 Tax=Tolypothrix sp. NIES-4075 TaxID=2005459 RepID=UPI00117F2B39|nr:hormogonium polysaccharide biosynthesis protein HpsA [Tolypothrix sp. NIES-4075]
MTKNKHAKAFTHIFQEIIKLHKNFRTQDFQWFLRSLLVTSRRQMEGGFVLPTTIMLLLIVALVITALLFRTFSRTTQAIGERQQQVIYNSATPAIDRAKAKLEYVFRQDTRLPAGVPSDSTIDSILAAPSTGTDDPYTLPGETRLANFKDANNNPGVGWYFKPDPSKDRIVAYSIIFKKTAANSSGTTVATLKDSATTKAPYLLVRNGPVNTSNSSIDKCGGAVKLASNEKDWEPITSATLAKTFQVTAFAVENASKPNRSVTTLEFQQDRQADKGNKWGAYFRYDLELFSGVFFRWNGAMHSDGNIFFGPYGNNFRAYLISSPDSCVNTSANDSKITTSIYTDNGNTTFKGQIITGKMTRAGITTGGDDQFGGSSTIDLYSAATPISTGNLTKDTDSINLPSGSTKTPANFALDPVALFTQDKFQSRDSTNRNNTTDADTGWAARAFQTKRRILQEATVPPYLDDTYRADDRYGPNPTYDGKPIAISQVKIPSGKKVGDNITTADTNKDALTRNVSPSVNNPEALGLDGYWERRAVKGGLRVIVGQRLELGNTLGSASSANLPNSLSDRRNEFLQRRTQRDNVAAVQATAVYHYKSNSGTAPVACMATTVHPGTAETLKRSATFETITFKYKSSPSAPTIDKEVFNDFFTGRGTNGWEFSIPTENTALANARSNLANFAGDPDGAFPPKQEAAGSSIMHPYPELTKYGDFSNLRRALAGTTIADQSYKDTANCMLGMLAYNIDYLNGYDYSANWGTDTNALLDELNAALSTAASAVLPNKPEQAIAALEASSVTNKDKLVKLARLVATKEQVERDRKNGIGYSCDNAKFNASATALDKLCASGVKYDALYYIFPISSDHPEDRTDPNSYITSSTVNPTSVANRYKAVSNTDISTIKSSPNTGTWNIPRSEATTYVTTAGNIPGAPNSLPNSNKPGYNNLVKYTNASGTTTYYQVAFKDSALFNGREMMNMRVLDIDLNLLRTTNAPGGDTWLPINDNTATDPNAPPPNGLVYAFREDAVREDAIERPAGTSMNAIPGSLSDPAIGTVNPTGNGITTKPVDYFPDPDRRPYGFRLKNGSRLDRGTNTAGMSFVSDNPIYIQGDLNLHSTDGTASNLLEEFKDGGTPGLLDSTWSNFYTRTSDLKDDRFAKPATDTWRPTEVLGDAVTILSDNFCDGSIEDGIIYLSRNSNAGLNMGNRYGCNTAANFTSYFNQNRPWLAFNSTQINLPNSTWIRENPYDSGSPIEITPEGKPKYCTNATVPCLTADKRIYEVIATGDANNTESYLRFTDQACADSRKCMGVASATRVNAIIVQNIIPSQAGQSYGGFHTFPRMIENWKDNIQLFMAGAFIQLRFSTQATGSFDQDAWEPGQAASAADENTWYFKPPDRRWGYDVALQYQTAGPVARRFATPGTTRTEVYRELPLDDPYVMKLRCAKDSSGNQIDPNTSCPS